NKSRMLVPDEVTPRLSKAFRYSKATDLRCSSVIVCFVRAITRSSEECGSCFSPPIGRKSEAADSVPGQQRHYGRRGLLFQSLDRPETCFPFHPRLRIQNRGRYWVRRHCI